MKVLFISNEVAPFAKVGGLADVAGSLPPALAELGVDVSVVMPLHRQVRTRDLEVVAPELHVEGPGRSGTASVLRGELPNSEVPIYFIRFDPYFNRPEIYGPAGGDYPDAPDRYAFLARAVLALGPALGVRFDLLHTNDWPTGLVPAFEVLGAGRPTVFTIHNLGYQGRFPLLVAPRIGIDPHSEAMRIAECHGEVNYLAAAIKTATVINTVSERYAEEIRTPQFGEELDGLLRDRARDLFGIINGIDYACWDPAHDAAVPAHYSPGAMSGKAVCKSTLQRQMGLPVDPDVPLTSAITRLVWQKGLDVLAEALPRLLELPVQFVLLGTGEPELEARYAALARAHPRQVAVNLCYDEDLARRIYAGSDMFLMPSRYEPCGLGQMMAMAYGTVPVVHATGGLADTVVEVGPEQTGFVSLGLTPGDLVFTMQRATTAWRDREGWRKLVLRCMAQDFSWTESAKKYAALYETALARG